MTGKERAEKIEAYGRAYSQLTQALKQFPKEMWKFRDSHGCWSVHEHIIHIADSEAFSYIWCRTLIAEPGGNLVDLDENQWSKSLDYHGQSADEALELFKLLRHSTCRLIDSLPQEPWSNASRHPRIGNVTLDVWLDVENVHISEHIQYMRENYEAWLNEKK